MVFLFDVLTFPVLGPIRGVIWVAEKIVEEANKELYDEDAVQGRLMELELRYDLGEISEEEYEEAEKVLLERLNAIREYKRAQLAEEGRAE